MTVGYIYNGAIDVIRMAIIRLAYQDERQWTGWASYFSTNLNSLVNWKHS